MRHDYPEGRVNGAFVGVVAAALMTSALAIAAVLCAVDALGIAAIIRAVFS